MAQWVDMEAENPRSEHVLVRDHLIWGWFEATVLSDRTQSRKAYETRDFNFLTPSFLPIEPLGGLDCAFKSRIGAIHIFFGQEKLDLEKKNKT